MAARDITDWIPIEYDPQLVTAQPQASAVEALAAPVQMGSETMEVARLLGADVNGGSQLTEDTHDGDKVTLYSYLFNGKVTLDEAETEDAFVSAVEGYNFNWLNTFNVSYDNAALGVTGDRSATASDFRPYKSLIYTLTNSDASAGYTANANVSSISASALVADSAGYDALSDVLGDVEDSDFGDTSQLVVIAHRSLRNALRKIKDDGGSPIFQVSGSNVDDETLFGYPVRWTAGAVESTTFKRTSTGAKLLFVTNRGAIRHGRRIDPQSRFIPAGINTDALEHTLQYRARKGFTVTVPQAAAALRVTS